MSVPGLQNIRSDIPAIAWPPISDGQPAVLAAMLRQLDSTQWLAREEIAAMQFQQLAVLAAHCRKYSPQFRNRLRQAGLTAQDLASAEGLRRLPLLRRRDLQGAGDLFCEEVPAAHAPLVETRTSGSTGEPVIVRRTNVSNFDWLALTMREHLWQGRDFTRPFCAIRAHVFEIQHLPDWGAPVNLLFDSAPSLGIPIATDLDRQLDMIADFAPGTLLSYPNNLAALARASVARGMALPSLHHIRTIGETLTPELRAEVAKVFAARIVDTYSSEEFGYVAQECPAAPLYHAMETVIVEILNDKGEGCAQGETGRVIVTDLRNFATPLIRYDIGDYAEAGPPCPCGRGLATIARILGRERNLVLRPDGSRFWPLVGGYYFRDIAPVRQFQLIQHELDRIEVRLVSETPVTPAQEEALGALINKTLGWPFRLEFVYFDGILPRGPGGKFEEFVCRVNM